MTMKNKYPTYISELILFKGTLNELKKGLKMADDIWDEKFKDIKPVKWKSKADDWEQCVKASNGWTKYGRLMYSTELDVLRSQDIMEFYLNSTVD